MAIDLSTLDAREALTAIYIGYYDRAADPAGLAFWEDVVGQDGFNLVSITTLFAAASETNDLFPFFADPASTTPTAFLTQLYLNLFNREPDDAGLAYWANELSAAVNGERADDDPNPGNPVLTVGQIITSIIEGAQAPDDVIITNKIAAALDWTATAETVSDFAYDDAAAQSAAAVIDGVDETQASVNAAAATTDTFFDPLVNPPVAGTEIDLEIGVTRVSGTEGDDQFNAFPGQNSLGGVANTLSSASNLDGKGGQDRLHADLTDEFTGSNFSGDTDVQPRIKNIEEIDIEARDGDGFTGGVTFDAKNVTDVEEIGSYFSDGDLTIENLTTLTADGDVRNTGDITIAMEHTGPFNSNSNASDLTVYFDNDYLVNDAPVNSGAFLTIELMDLDAETVGDDPLLDNPFGLITFTFGGELKTLDYGTDSNTYAELLADIQDAISLAAQTDADFSQLTASFGEDFTVQDTDTDPNPAQPDLTGTTIVITNSGPEELEAITMQATGAAPAGKDFHTGFSNEAPTTEEFPISVGIELHKAGRGGEGGDLIVGGKATATAEGIAGGIEVFNVSVKGEGEGAAAGDAKPSNIGTLTSTLGALKTVNIVTHEDFTDGDTFASLEIRDGFNALAFDVNGNPIENPNESGDLETVDANGFKGNLTLGSSQAIVNLDTLTALGGGDVTFTGILNGMEAGDTSLATPQAYTYLTGAGEDSVTVTVSGDALDFAGSSLEIKTGEGDDEIDVTMGLVTDVVTSIGVNASNEQLNQAVLDNVDIDGEGGDDIINVDGLGNANIDGSEGNDIIYTDGNGAGIITGEGTAADPFVTVVAPNTKAAWAFNFDNARADAQGLPSIPADEIPGVQSSLAYLDGATVTVTLSGAGIGNAAAGGGVMALPVAGAVQGDDGYEASFVITDLINGNDYYGDQRDVNLAVINAIEEDAVLNALLSVEMGPNNTLLITSKTSGDFDATDLRIDVAHNTAETASYAGDVLAEARELFSNSDLTLTNLWGFSTFTTERDYQATAPGADLTTSSTANDWYDGLSVLGDTNEADDNLHTRGSASNLETDNVINGGADDDIIVLSTDATPATTLNYTPGGNNSMLDGSSNETVVMTGPDFGDDTVMNFTTVGETDRTVTLAQTVGTVSEYVQGGEETIDPADPGTPETFTLDISTVPVTSLAYTVVFGTVTVNIPADATNDEVADLIAAAFADDNVSGYTATVTGAGELTFTAGENADQDPDVIAGDFDSTPSFEDNITVTVIDGTDPATITSNESFTVTFFDATLASQTDSTITILGVTSTVSVGDEDTDIASTVAGADYTGTGYAATNNSDGTVTFTSTNVGVDEDPDADIAAFDLSIAGDMVTTVPAALDFLDFTEYLGSMQDLSSAAGGSDVSNTLIPVTLDFDLVNIQANEVAVVQFDNTPSTDDWAGLNASVVQDLINNSATANDYGTLTASAANADDEYTQTATTDQLIDGAASAVIMIENADNLGEYKVFQAIWDGDASNDADSTLNGAVEVTQIGSLDFGTSLDGLTDVNLVGTAGYDALVANGILA